MPLDATAAEFRRAALELKAADRSLMLLARRNIRAATAPAGAAVAASARATLPHGGGLNEWVASAPVKTSILLGARTAGVRLVQSRRSGSGKKSDLADIDAEGQVRHPVFGHRKAWSSTSVEPGYATKAVYPFKVATEAACMAVMVEASAIAGFH